MSVQGTEARDKPFHVVDFRGRIFAEFRNLESAQDNAHTRNERATELDLPIQCSYLVIRTPPTPLPLPQWTAS